MSPHGHSLIKAAWNGCTECVKLLIDKEGGLRDDYGETALMWAAEKGRLECVKLLVNKEAGLRSNSGMTALMKSVLNGHLECVKILIDKEAGLQDNNGKSALMWAAWNGCTDCVKLLIDKEGGLRDDYGETALMWAAEKGRLECVKLLIDKEAGLQNKDGKSALMYAAENGSSDCVKPLMDKEAGLQDKDGKTALDYAIRNNKISCVRILYNNDSLFSWSCLPNIPIGSFLDILNKAAKQSGKNYDDSMVKISDKLEKLPQPILLEYLNISNIKELESRLINDFPEYKEKIPSIIKELETEEFTCPVCLDELIPLYRNCVNCTWYACKECWEKMNECMICRSTLYWEKCLNIELLQKNHSL